MNKIYQDLQKEPDTNASAYSRNLIKRAIKDLSSGSSEQHLDTIYQHIFRNQSKDTVNASEDTIVDTHPSNIEWEVTEFIKAMARARAFYGKRKVSAVKLADKALDFLMESLSICDRNEPDQDFRTIQMLKEPYIQDQIIHQYHSEIANRLHLVCQLTLDQPARISVNAIRKALPLLDNLIIDLAQDIDSSEEPPPSAPDTIQRLYHSLHEVRNQITRRKDGETQFYFHLSDETLAPLLADLYKDFKNFNEARKKIADDDRKRMETNYNRFWVAYVKEHDATGIQQIQTFLASYNDLRAYVQSQPSTEDLRKSIMDEFGVYARQLFLDAENCDWLPYTYSLYQTDSASTAFIAERTKYAHEQIRAAIHIPLRLLQAYSYMTLFHLTDVISPIRVQDSPQKIGPFTQWYDAVVDTLHELKKAYPELSLFWKARETGVQAFLRNYERLVPPLFGGDTFGTEEITETARVIRSPSFWGPLIEYTSILLKATCQLIAAAIANQAADEIVGQYQALMMQRELSPEQMSQ